MTSTAAGDHGSSLPPEGWEPLFRLAKRAKRPLDRFLRIEAASGVVLLVAAAAALAWANSSWSSSYLALWHAPIGVRIGSFAFERSLEWVVNDGLMVIFFFVVGLEIRREAHHGELSTLRGATLPVVAALGGMIAPAALYLVFAGAEATRSGWGVPMATDIAFALGVLALLGKREPPALRVLLLALAVIDDLGAIVVIALFYSSHIAPSGLVVAALGVGGIFLLRAIGVRAKSAYVVPGVVVWAGTYASGIHPTIAGVVIGLLTPVRAWLGADGFVEHARAHLEGLSDAGHRGDGHALTEALHGVNLARREAISPAESLIHMLHPWVAFAIMPTFALANAGVSLDGVSLDGDGARVAFAVGIGLVVGKPLGVLLACGAALRARLATLPIGLSARHLVVLGVVAGIGFTMSLFIAQLAFADAALLGAAKLGVLVASAIAAVVGLAAGAALLRAEAVAGAAESADEAEASIEK